MPNTDILEKLDIISNNVGNVQTNYNQYLEILKDIVLDSNKGKELVISVMRRKGINISEDADYNIISDTIKNLAIGNSTICNMKEIFDVVHKAVDNTAAVTEKFGGMSLLFDMNISDNNDINIEKTLEESEE